MASPFQFSSLVMFWIVSLFATALATFGGITGCIVAGFVCCFWAIVFSSRHRLAAFVWAVVLLLVALVFLLPRVQTVREAARRTMCLNQMRQILIGILNYQSEHGHLPPPYIADENGKPLLSWRVLILPYIEGEALFQKFRLDEPWDSVANRKLLSQVPETYQCPCRFESVEQGYCHYAAVLGPNTAWQVGEPDPQEELADPSKTLLLTEVLRPIPWTKPQDVTPQDFVTQARQAIAGQESLGHLVDQFFTTTSTFWFAVGYADGHVIRAVTVPKDPDVLARHASRLKNTPKPQEEFGYHSEHIVIGPPPVRIKWHRVTSFSLFVLTSLAPLAYARRSTVE